MGPCFLWVNGQPPNHQSKSQTEKLIDESHAHNQPFSQQTGSPCVSLIGTMTSLLGVLGKQKGLTMGNPFAGTHLGASFLRAPLFGEFHEKKAGILGTEARKSRAAHEARYLLGTLGHGCGQLETNESIPEQQRKPPMQLANYSESGSDLRFKQPRIFGQVVSNLGEKTQG